MQGKFYSYWGAENSSAYEFLNKCTDPEQHLEKFLWNLAPIDDKLVMDVGAGSGFHVVRYAQKAKHVFAVEPDPGMIRQIYTRLCSNFHDNISVILASAESIPLSDNTMDVAYARFAYFFGDIDCLPGLSEVKRILKPGGHFFIIDTNPDRSQFGEIAKQVYPNIFHENYQKEHTLFYKEHGFSYFEVDTVLRAPNREILAEVLQMDFPKKYKDIMEQVEGTELSYSLSVYHFYKPS